MPGDGQLSNLSSTHVRDAAQEESQPQGRLGDVGRFQLAITLDTYSHMLPNMQDSVVRTLEKAIR